MASKAMKNRAQPQSQTLWLDGSNAWRQNDDAIIIPISYLDPEPVNKRKTAETAIIPMIMPTSLPGSNADLASDSDDLEGLFAERNSQPVFHSFFLTAPEKSFIRKTGHLSVAVPMLLLGVIALVVFAWMTFR